MVMPFSMRDWVRLPSRIALLLGAGALSVVGAKTAPAAPVHSDHEGAPTPQHSVKAFGDLLIWQEGGRILVSEAGGPAEELPLGNTAEAAALRQLLVREGATAALPHALRDRIILVGAGGAGLHWKAEQPSDKPVGSPSPAGRDPGGQTDSAPKPRASDDTRK